MSRRRLAFDYIGETIRIAHAEDYNGINTSPQLLNHSIVSVHRNVTKGKFRVINKGFTGFMNNTMKRRISTQKAKYANFEYAKAIIRIKTLQLNWITFKTNLNRNL